VALVHQIRVIDKMMLLNKLGTLDPFTVSEIDNITRYTLDI
jgi:mRNA-degrading endonuclease toxin of MazEF toxin-antitoxin module